jgi:hypothetical protein
MSLRTAQTELFAASIQVSAANDTDKERRSSRARSS